MSRVRACAGVGPGPLVFGPSRGRLRPAWLGGVGEEFGDADADGGGVVRVDQVAGLPWRTVLGAPPESPTTTRLPSGGRLQRDDAERFRLEAEPPGPARHREHIRGIDVRRDVRPRHRPGEHHRRPNAERTANSSSRSRSGPPPTSSRIADGTAAGPEATRGSACPAPSAESAATHRRPPEHRRARALCGPALPRNPGRTDACRPRASAAASAVPRPVTAPARSDPRTTSTPSSSCPPHHRSAAAPAEHPVRRPTTSRARASSRRSASRRPVAAPAPSARAARPPRTAPGPRRTRAAARRRAS